MIDPVLDYQENLLSRLNLKIKKTDVVLDLGCGRGDNAVLFLKKVKKVVGVDIEKWPEWQQIKLKNLKFIEADAQKLPFKDNSFDVVFTKDTLHHIDNKVQALKEIKRVTKKHGLIYIVEYNRYNPIGYLHLVLPGNHDHFSQKEFQKLIKKFFKRVKYRKVECRVYPFVKSEKVINIIHQLEKIMEKIPLINHLVVYNIAVIKNEKN